MEADLVQGKIGAVGKYDVAFKEGQLVIEGDAAVGASSVVVVMKVDGKQVLDAIAAAVPGTLDDAVIKLLEAALLGK